ncbi:MAG: DEAD/DEAH box helicase [Bacteroidales bacterium]|nr:DEAD/DEAH box helicase [Bacteroidales bacterium]
MEKFRALGLSEDILKGIEELGFETPTPIQERVIPVVLSGCEDLVALAQTGTGKTAAFGLPLLQSLDLDSKSIQALILSPTRELCVQICNDLIKYSKYLPQVKCTAVYGGTDIRKQINTIEKGVHILVATPGRLCDLIRREAVNINQVRWVVLDEADEMLNMGFQEDLNFILEETPKERNTFLFSATMPVEVERIAKNYLKNPQEITTGKRNQGADTVSHIYYQVMAKDCYETLRRVIDCEPDMYAIIFTRTKNDARDIVKKLQKDGVDCDALHGDLSQAQRDDVMSRFRAKLLKVLVATDVAARGLDVDNLTHVINYNLPEDIESYTHRSGRTGRAGKEGISVSIINARESGKIRRLEKMLRRPFTFCKVPSGEDVGRAQLHYYADKVVTVEPKEDVDKYVGELFAKFQEMDKEMLIRKVFAYEFGKLLKKYRNAKDLNIMDAPKPKGEQNDRSTYKVFSINVGRNDGFSPRSLMEIINYCAPRRGMDIGGIRVGNDETKFEIDVDGVKNFPRFFNGIQFEDTLIKVKELDEEPVSTPKVKKERWSKERRDRGEGKSERKRGDKRSKRNNTAQNKYRRANAEGAKRNSKGGKRGK